MFKFSKSRKIGKNSLTKYIILSYILVVLTLISFASRSFDSFLERETMRMETTSYEIENAFTSTLDYTESVLNYINRKIAICGGDSQKVGTIIKSFDNSNTDYNSVRDVFSTGTFFWINDQKMMVMSSEYGVIKMPLDVSGRDYLIKTIETPWKIFTGSPVIGAASGQFVIPAGVGAVDENNKYIGTVAVGFKVYDLIEKFSKLSRRNRTDFAILDNNNKVLMESSEGLFSGNKHLFKVLGSMSDNTDGILIDYSFFAPKKSYVMLRSFEKYPYHLVVSLKNDFVTAGAFSEITPHIIELIIITIFFATILYFIRTVLKK